MVVDDDPQMLRYVRDTLTVVGYAAVVTGDHVHLSRTIRSERPHLVLLDLVLPGADGLARHPGVAACCVVGPPSSAVRPARAWRVIRARSRLLSEDAVMAPVFRRQAQR